MSKTVETLIDSTYFHGKRFDRDLFSFRSLSISFYSSVKETPWTYFLS